MGNCDPTFTIKETSNIFRRKGHLPLLACESAMAGADERTFLGARMKGSLLELLHRLMHFFRPPGLVHPAGIIARLECMIVIFWEPAMRSRAPRLPIAA